MSHDDVERELAVEREIQQLLWNVKPLLSAGQDDEAAHLALSLRDELTERGELHAAASVSSIAATFFGRAGDRAAAMEAARRATSLHPDPDFRIDYAKRHARYGDRATAARILDGVLSTPGLTPASEHRAFAAMAATAAADGQDKQACTLLAKSRQVAVGQSLPSMMWDLDVVRELSYKRFCAAELNAYLVSLLERARSDGAHFIVDDVKRLLARLS